MSSDKMVKSTLSSQSARILSHSKKIMELLKENVMPEAVLELENTQNEVFDVNEMNNYYIDAASAQVYQLNTSHSINEMSVDSNVIIEYVFKSSEGVTSEEHTLVRLDDLNYHVETENHCDSTEKEKDINEKSTNEELWENLLETSLLSSILQLATIDVISTCVAAIEIWSINQQSWTLSTLCPLYLGTEVLINTLVVYFIISINFHIISNLNAHLYEIRKNNKNPLTSNSDDEESVQTLVAESQNRNVVIDYRRKIIDIPVIFPSLLVWFICLSLSIPQYSLSSTISINNNYTLCTIVDTNYRQLLQNLLMVFRVAVPLPLLLISLIILLQKYFEHKYCKTVVNNRNSYQMQRIIIFAFLLSLLYIITSSQRQVMYVLHVSTQEFRNTTIDGFRMPPIDTIICSSLGNLISAMVHYVASIFRAILYLTMIPEVQNRLYFRLFISCINN